MTLMVSHVLSGFPKQVRIHSIDAQTLLCTERRGMDSSKTSLSQKKKSTNC